MVRAYRFDAQHSERLENWEAACEQADSKKLVWVALSDPSDEEVARITGALELGDEIVPLLREPPDRASVADDGQHVYVTLVAVAGEEDAPALVSLECAPREHRGGTSHPAEAAGVEEI